MGCCFAHAVVQTVNIPHKSMQDLIGIYHVWRSYAAWSKRSGKSPKSHVQHQQIVYDSLWCEGGKGNIYQRICCYDLVHLKAWCAPTRICGVHRDLGKCCTDVLEANTCPHPSYVPSTPNGTQQQEERQGGTSTFMLCICIHYWLMCNLYRRLQIAYARTTGSLWLDADL